MCDQKNYKKKTNEILFKKKKERRLQRQSLKYLSLLSNSKKLFI